jgi:hypothetical protein
MVASDEPAAMPLKGSEGDPSTAYMVWLHCHTTELAALRALVIEITQ